MAYIPLVTPGLVFNRLAVRWAFYRHDTGLLTCQASGLPHAMRRRLFPHPGESLNMGPVLIRTRLHQFSSTQLCVSVYACVLACSCMRDTFITCSCLFLLERTTDKDKKAWNDNVVVQRQRMWSEIKTARELPFFFLLPSGLREKGGPICFPILFFPLLRLSVLVGWRRRAAGGGNGGAYSGLRGPFWLRARRCW